MLLPKNFSKTIADRFYDKSVEVLAVTDSFDAEGGVVKTDTVKSTFKGNVRFTKLGAIQEEIGLVESIDVAITCDVSVQIAKKDLLQYAGRKYQVTDAIPSDSHLLIVGKVWSA